jgi:RimJ/RimL family protein N-acetyltransferase
VHLAGEIGTTRVALDRQGTGVNTEAKYLQLVHCFEALGAHRISFRVDTRNGRSKAAVEKIGGVYEGIARRHMVLHDGYVRDSAWYSITDVDWPDVKARLESLLAR